MERKTGRGGRPLTVVGKQGGRWLDWMSARIDRVSRRVWDQHAVGDWGSEKGMALSRRLGVGDLYAHSQDWGQ